MVAVSLITKECDQTPVRCRGCDNTGLLQGMREQGGVLTKGVLTHERRWSETILCFHAHEMAVKVRHPLENRGW